MSDLAAALLRDVPTRYQHVNGDRLLHESDVLAALSRALDPAIAERAGEVLEALLHEERIATSAEAVDFRNTADLITALLAQNAALRVERDEAYAYAKYMAEVIFANGKFDAPQWEPLEDTLGVLTQIDNMVAGIRARAEAAEAQIATLTARVELLTGALYPLSVLPIGDRTADDVPLYGLDERYITHGDIRRARAALTTEADNG